MADYEKQLKEILLNDEYIMASLKAVEGLKLEDTWISAGLIRNRVWDKLANVTTPVNDIDVIYFDALDISWAAERQLEKELVDLLPNRPWSVKNQARMHQKSGFDPFTSSYDGVAHFPETPTAVAARIYDGELEIMAPYGLEDLFEMRVKPTSFYQKGSDYYSIYVERVKSKKWNEIWEDITIYFS